MCTDRLLYRDCLVAQSGKKEYVSWFLSVAYNNEALLEITKELAVGLNKKWPDERKEFKRAENLL